MDYNDDELKSGLKDTPKADDALHKYTILKEFRKSFLHIISSREFLRPDDIPDDLEEIPATIEVKDDADWDANSGKSFQETMQNRKIKFIPNPKSFLPDDDFEVRKYIKSGSSVLGKAYGVEKVPLLSPKAYERIAQCSNWLIFGCESPEKKALLRANSCGYKLCPICQWKRSSRNSAQLGAMVTYCCYGDSLLQLANDKLDAIVEQENGVCRPLCDDELQELIAKLNQAPKYTFMFLTLTVKNCAYSDDLKEFHKQLKIYVQRLFKYKFFQALQVRGFVTKFEITRNVDTGEFHPHFHIIIAIDRNTELERRGINQKRLWQNIQAAWLNMTGDSYIVQNKIIRDIYSAIREITKYECKPDGITDFSKYSDMTDSDKQRITAEYLAQTFRLKSITYSGIFKEAKKRLTNGDLGCLVTRELIKISYTETWVWSGVKYALSKVKKATGDFLNEIYNEEMANFAKMDDGGDDFVDL